MRPVLLAALFAAFLLIPVYAQEKALGELNLYGDFLVAEGVWRADNFNDKTEITFDSVTRIECYKHGGAYLVGSDSYCMQATAGVASGVPDIQVAYYPVLTWDNDKVIAADSSTSSFPICIWTQIAINLHDHSVMATDTRKLGKGHEGLNKACELLPLAQTYHLMDKLQEFRRRSERAARKSKGSK